MKNLSVQVYRGWLILWIVLFHYSCRITELYPSISFHFKFDMGGVVGVMFFFLISGFYLCQGIMKFDKQTPKGVCRYIVNKYLRLWFPYVIAVVLIFTMCQIMDLPGRTATLKEFLINCILLYHPKIGFVDSAHWYIGHLIVVQCIVSFFLLLQRKFRLKALICYEFICIMLLCFNSYVHDSITNKVTSILCMDSSLKVFLGFNFWAFFSSESTRKMKRINLLLLVLLLSYYCIKIDVFYVVVYSYITYIVLYDKIPSKLLLYPFVYIGNVSFEWYLIHQNIGFIIICYLYGIGITNEISLLIPMFATFMIGISINSLTNNNKTIIKRILYYLHLS